MGHWSNSVDGSQHNNKWASTWHQEHDAKNKQLLDYLATHSDVTVQFHASDMISNLQRIIFIRGKCTQPSMQTLLYGMETQSHSANQIEWSIFHLVWNITVCHCIRSRGRIGALILRNCKQATIFLLTLEEMGHPQLLTPVHCNNSTAVGIANNTVKHQRSRSTEMRFSGLLMQSKLGRLTSNAILGKKILETNKANTVLAHNIQHLPLVLAWKDITLSTTKSQQA